MGGWGQINFAASFFFLLWCEYLTQMIWHMFVFWRCLILWKSSFFKKKHCEIKECWQTDKIEISLVRQYCETLTVAWEELTFLSQNKYDLIQKKNVSIIMMMGTQEYHSNCITKTGIRIKKKRDDGTMLDKSRIFHPKVYYWQPCTYFFCVQNFQRKTFSLHFTVRNFCGCCKFFKKNFFFYKKWTSSNFFLEGPKKSSPSKIILLKI